MSRGIDISHHNTCTNYTAAKAAVDWVYIKVTEGSTYVDPVAGTHYDGFAGRPRGAYHFMRGSSPAEVANFVKQVRARRWELPPMLDAEYAGVTGAAIKGFMGEYRRQTGEELRVVYSSKSLFQGACNPATFITPQTILWAARYYANNPTFSTLGWDHPQLGIYQYWNAGAVPGFAAGIDVDIARINLSEADMPFTQADAATIFWGTPFDGNDNFAQYLKGHVAKLEAGQAGILAAVQAATKDPGITIDAMRQIVNDAVAQHVVITGEVHIGPASEPAA